MEQGSHDTTVKTRPIIIDLGKVKKKKIKQLKRGSGDLIAEVDQAVATAANSLGAEAGSKTLVPVVILYQKKVVRRKGLFG
jgi:hypothetical protein